MTTYVSSVPSALRGNRFTMWADTSEELFGMMLRLEADWAHYYPAAHPGWFESAWITGEQFADACLASVTITDFCGPAEFLARRNGNAHHLAWIEKHRRQFQADHT